MAILTVILTCVIVLCAFTSPEEEGVLVVSEYYADEAQQNLPEAESAENNVKVHLDGSQPPPVVLD